MKLVIASGYFNPLHSGHINYLNEAKKLGDKLIVIVNNDLQVTLKGSKPFMNREERETIIVNLKAVDYIITSQDKDSTVIKTLEQIKILHSNIYDSFIFAKGGDRTITNIPERVICDKLGIRLAFNVGGRKTQSSSELLKKVK